MPIINCPKCGAWRSDWEMCGNCKDPPLKSDDIDVEALIKAWHEGGLEIDPFAKAIVELIRSKTSLSSVLSERKDG